MISPSVSGGSCDVEVLIRSGGHLLTVPCFHILVVLLTDGGSHTYAGRSGGEVGLELAASDATEFHPWVR